jgi:hypothetical protein
MLCCGHVARSMCARTKCPRVLMTTATTSSPVRQANPAQARRASPSKVNHECAV